MVCEVTTEIVKGKTITYLEFCPISKSDIASIPLNYMVIIWIYSYGSGKIKSGWVNKNPNNFPFYFKPSMIQGVGINMYCVDQIYKEVKIDDCGGGEHDVLALENKNFKNLENIDILKMNKIKIDITNIDVIEIVIFLEQDFEYEENKKIYDIEYYENKINLAKTTLKK
jgi:hypothetical protein